MNNLFKNPSHKAQIGYNGFPMDSLLKFTSTVGELLPVYYDILQPGDKVTCDYQLKTRTMELASAAMMSVTENVDWFFVPMNQIYQFFGDWYFGIQDFKTSFADLSGPQQTALPFLSKAEFQKLLTNCQAYPDFLVDGGSLTNHELVGTSYRLLDMLGTAASFLLENSPTPQSGLSVPEVPMGFCPIFACAYQKIWFDYYRLSDRTANDPHAYNLDRFSSSAAIDASTESLTLAKMISLRYRPWKRNFFTSLYTSPLFGGGSVGAFSEADGDNYLLDSYHQWLFNSASGVYSSLIQPDGDGNIVEPSALVNRVTETSPTAARSAFALQKLLEITRRSGKHFDDQTLAHFGIKPNTGISGEVMFLGHNESVINIGDVISMADTEAAPLGKIGGKGYGFGKGSSIKFTAPTHGILMAVYSAEPEQDFTAVGYDKLNALMNRADWFTPEFDNLGMQPLFLYQCDAPASVYERDLSPSDIIGWQYRFSELKCKYNRVLGGFARDLAYWTPQTIFNSNHPSSFYVNPKYLDSVMLVPYNFKVTEGLHTDGYDPYKYDPLIHELFIDVKKASKMSTYGLEQL